MNFLHHKTFPHTAVDDMLFKKRAFLISGTTWNWGETGNSCWEKTKYGSGGLRNTELLQRNWLFCPQAQWLSGKLSLKFILS